MAVATALTEEMTRRGYEVFAAREGFRSLTGDSLGNDPPLVRLVWGEDEAETLRAHSVPPVAMHRRIGEAGCAFRSERFRGFSAAARVERAARFVLAGGFRFLVGVGGNGTFAGTKAISDALAREGDAGRPRTGFINVSVDSDLLGDRSVGFATGVEEGARIARGLFEDAFTHGRIYLLETMGNRSGKHALHAGVAARAHLVVLPGFDLPDGVVADLAAALDARPYALVVVAEGYRKADGGPHAAGRLRAQLCAAGLCDREDRRVIGEPFSRYLRGLPPNALDIEAAVLKSQILVEALEAGADRVMAYHLGEHDHGVRPFDEIRTDDAVEPAYLGLIDRLGVPSFRAWVAENFRGFCPWPPGGGPARNRSQASGIQPDMKRTRFGTLLGIFALLFVAACGAPKAEAVGGDIGRAVTRSIEAGRGTFDHGDWDALLRAAVDPATGRVDYPLLARRRAELDRYLAAVAAAPLETLSRDESFALLANAYNAYTVASILDHPGVRSIRDIPGVWTRTKHRVAGFDLTLDEIEHKILRPYYRDPRVHFVINCASASCAPLAPFALTGANLDETLDARTRFALAKESFLRIERNTIFVSSYFKWFPEDFGDVRAFLVKYAPPEKAEWIEAHPDAPIRYLDYDWSLNGPSPPPSDRRGGAPAANEASEGPPGGLAARLVARVDGLVRRAGPAGPVVFALAYAAATVAFLPGSALTLLAGALFGPVVGTATVAAGATAGATAAFLLARTVLRRRVERWIEARPAFRAIDGAIEKEGAKIVALLRLSPVFPFNLLNYALGLTRVSLAAYVAASFVFMLPGTFLYVYLGSVGAEVGRAAAGAAAGAGWGRIVLQGIGLAATIAVTVVVTRAARRALAEAVPEAS